MPDQATGSPGRGETAGTGNPGAEEIVYEYSTKRSMPGPRIPFVYLDDAAVIFRLLTVSWTVPGFSVERYDSTRRRLDRQIRRDGGFTVHDERYLGSQELTVVPRHTVDHIGSASGQSRTRGRRAAGPGQPRSRTR